MARAAAGSIVSVAFALTVAACAGTAAPPAASTVTLPTSAPSPIDAPNAEIEWEMRSASDAAPSARVPASSPVGAAEAASSSTDPAFACAPPERGFFAYHPYRAITRGRVAIPKLDALPDDGGLDLLVPFHFFDAARRALAEVAHPMVLAGFDLGERFSSAALVSAKKAPRKRSAGPRRARRHQGIPHARVRRKRCESALQPSSLRRRRSSCAPPRRRRLRTSENGRSSSLRPKKELAARPRVTYIDAIGTAVLFSARDRARPPSGARSPQRSRLPRDPRERSRRRFRQAEPRRHPRRLPHQARLLLRVRRRRRPTATRGLHRPLLRDRDETRVRRRRPSRSAVLPVGWEEHLRRSDIPTGTVTVACITGETGFFEVDVADASA